MRKMKYRHTLRAIAAITRRIRTKVADKLVTATAVTVGGFLTFCGGCTGRGGCTGCGGATWTKSVF